MAEYRGLRAIAKRMGWKAPATLLRLQEKQGFLMYPRATANGFQWVTTDDLIFCWEKRLSEEAVEWRKRRIKPPFWDKQGRKTVRKNGNGKDPAKVRTRRVTRGPARRNDMTEAAKPTKQ